MADDTRPVDHRPVRPLILALVMLGGCHSMVAGAPGADSASAPAASAAQVTQITLERGCFGCTTGSILVLRRDGSALETVTGNARSGTADRSKRGSIAGPDFDALARLAVAEGFFDLQATYEAPGVQDGPWATTTISRGNEEKQVFSRDAAGPPALKAIEAAVEAARTRIQFRP